MGGLGPGSSSSSCLGSLGTKRKQLTSCCRKLASHSPFSRSLDIRVTGKVVHILIFWLSILMSKTSHKKRHWWPAKRVWLKKVSFPFSKHFFYSSVSWHFLFSPVSKYYIYIFSCSGAIKKGQWQSANMVPIKNVTDGQTSIKSCSAIKNVTDHLPKGCD